MQGPVYLGCLSICKSELGLGRDVRVGDEVLHKFDGLGKALDCTPAAHGYIRCPGSHRSDCAAG